jgi:hypothetical protein
VMRFQSARSRQDSEHAHLVRVARFAGFAFGVCGSRKSRS